MSIRAFHNADFSKVQAIYAASKLDELRFEKGEFKLLPLAEDEKRYRQFLEAEVLVYDDGKVQAYGALHGSEISALFVHPSARGQGIGRSMLDYMLSKITGNARLSLAKTNMPARKLYESFGFQVTAEFQTEYNGTSVLANEMIRFS